MEDLRESRDRVGSAFRTKAKLTKRAALFVKICLVLSGAFLSGAAAFFSASTFWPLSSSQILGLIGLALALAGGIFVVLTEEDTSDVLDDARRAIDKFENEKLISLELNEDLEDLELAVRRLSSLYTLMSLARGTIEQAVLHGKTNELSLVETCLKVTKRELRIALGIMFDEVWTICVYRATKSASGDGMELELVAHDRSVECDKSKARRWREGIGVGGIAFAKNAEVVVPDLAGC